MLGCLWSLWGLQGLCHLTSAWQCKKSLGAYVGDNKAADHFGVKRRVFNAFSHDCTSSTESVLFHAKCFLGLQNEFFHGINLPCLRRGQFLLSKSGYVLSSTTLFECSCHPTVAFKSLGCLWSPRRLQGTVPINLALCDPKDSLW